MLTNHDFTRRGKVSQTGFDAEWMTLLVATDPPLRSRTSGSKTCRPAPLTSTGTFTTTSRCAPAATSTSAWGIRTTGRFRCRRSCDSRAELVDGRRPRANRRSSASAGSAQWGEYACSTAVPDRSSGECDPCSEFFCNGRYPRLRPGPEASALRNSPLYSPDCQRPLSGVPSDLSPFDRSRLDAVKSQGRFNGPDTSEPNGSRWPVSRNSRSGPGAELRQVVCQRPVPGRDRDEG